MTKHANNSDHLQMVDLPQTTTVEIPLPILGAFANIENSFFDLCFDAGSQVLTAMMEQDREDLCGSMDPEFLSEEELLRYRLIIHNALWSIWNLHSQARVAELSAETWQAQIAILRRLLSSRGTRRFWANYGEEFGVSFQQVVEEIIREAGDERESNQANTGEPAA